MLLLFATYVASYLALLEQKNHTTSVLLGGCEENGWDGWYKPRARIDTTSFTARTCRNHTVEGPWTGVLPYIEFCPRRLLCPSQQKTSPPNVFFFDLISLLA